MHVNPGESCLMSALDTYSKRRLVSKVSTFPRTHILAGPAWSGEKDDSEMRLRLWTQNLYQSRKSYISQVHLR